MKYPPSFIEKVLESSNLVQYISQYTTLKHSGGGFLGRCPFPDHPEKTPSFSVSETKQVYHCFGCGKSGNVFTFLKDFNGMSFKDSVEHLASRAGLEPPAQEHSEGADRAQSLKKEIMKANKSALQFFKSQLATSEIAQKYLIERGLTKETALTFQLGFAPDAWDGLASHLTRRGISLEIAEKAKLVRPRKEGSGFYDVFRNRLIFPILNNLSEPIAFGGRSFDGTDPKYLNSPESEVFQKGKLFYGSGITTRYLRGDSPILIVEGYMDLIALFEAGFKSTLATLGTALTLDHCHQLKKLGSPVIALFDGDRAGQAAMERSLPLFFSAGVLAKAIVLPDGQDPDDFLKSGGAGELQNLIHGASDLFHVILRKWMVQSSANLSDRLGLVQPVMEVLEKISDPASRSAYTRVAAETLGVEARAFANSTTKPKVKMEAEKEKEPAKNLTGLANSEPPSMTRFFLSGAPKIELEILRLVVKNHAQFEELLLTKWRDILTNVQIQEFIAELEKLTRQKPGKFDSFLSLLIPQIDTPSTLMTSMLRPAEAAVEAAYFIDLLKNLKMRHLQKQIDETNRLLKLNPEMNLMSQLIDLKKQKMTLGKCPSDEVMRWLQ